MNLRDATARAMMEQVVRHPDCPPTVVCAWENYRFLHGSKRHWRMGKGYSTLWNKCVREFHEHYEKISEILCTENGQIDGQNSGPETNDARKK